jgi:hypothetical protein
MGRIVSDFPSDSLRSLSKGHLNCAPLLVSILSLMPPWCALEFNTMNDRKLLSKHPVLQKTVSISGCFMRTLRHVGFHGFDSKGGIYVS